MPTWPVWPQADLDRLVGPHDRHLRHLDLSWLYRLEALDLAVSRLSAAVDGPASGPSGLSLLTERAVLLGYRGHGPRSAGTSCRLLEAADGWLAVNLPRQDDLDSIPALFESRQDDDPWAIASAGVRERTTADVVTRAALLGLAIAAVPTSWEVDAQRETRDESTGPRPCVIEPASRFRGGEGPTVIDLTSLWAGPLAGWYLARAGASVIKLESTTRPDGARRGTPAFYRRLNAGKTLVEVDLSTVAGVDELRSMITDADIVIEASRPRAMERFDIDPMEHVASGGIWCSITGYGRTGPDANRIAFGDDAAAAGGLVTFVDDEPWFIADAAADPIAGLTAAAGVLASWAEGRAGLVDVAMRDAVAHLTGGAPVLSRDS